MAQGGPSDTQQQQGVLSACSSPCPSTACKPRAQASPPAAASCSPPAPLLLSGAPSLVQGGGHVGATDLLCAEAGEVAVCDMDAPISEVITVQGGGVLGAHWAEGRCSAFLPGRHGGCWACRVQARPAERSVCVRNALLITHHPPLPAVSTHPRHSSARPPHAQLADRVEALLSDRAGLAAVGRAAQVKACSWTERDNAAALVGYVQAALAARAAPAAGKAGGATGGVMPGDGRTPKVASCASSQPA